jgi:MFS family permease
MVLVSRAVGFLEILTLYVVTGLGSGLANVPMMGLVSHWFSRSKRGRAAGTMLMGNGFAIVFAGLLIPFVHTALGGEGWRTNWRILGTLAVCTAAVAAYFLRNRPAGAAQHPPAARGGSATGTDASAHPEKRAQRWVMAHLGCIYALFGTTYAVYATFIVTTMVNERGFGEGTAGRFWAAVGALSIASGPLFGWLSDRLGRKLGIQVVYSLFTISYALVAADLPNPFLYLSIAIFGLAVWSIPTIMTAAVGDYVAPDLAVKAFGFVTLFFGAGQIAGPVIAGSMADLTGNFNLAFGGCALLTAGAAVLTQFLKPPPEG